MALCTDANAGGPSRQRKPPQTRMQGATGRLTRNSSSAGTAGAEDGFRVNLQLRRRAQYACADEKTGARRVVPWRALIRDKRATL